MIKITDEQYKKWIHYSRVIVSQTSRISNKDIEYSATELLHDLMIKFDNNCVKKDNMTENYVFISLKNLWIDKLKKKNKVNICEFDTNYMDVDQDEYDSQIDIERKEKMDIILKCIRRFNTADKKLFYLYFINNITGREIAKQVNMSINFIYGKINDMKDHIRSEYEKQRKNNNQ